jgi:hypothetical protein
LKRGDKSEITLPSGPFVDPTVAARNPAAASYAQQMKERMGGAPRGGAPTPPIPPLNMPHQPGMTMADQAIAHRAAESQGPMPSIVQPAVASAPTPGLLTTDLLPEAARQDPMYQEGHGSMYAVNQPHLAFKYGVIRNGQFIPPQQLSTGRPGLKPQTVEGLKALQSFNEQRKAAESGEAAAERAAAEGPAGAAAGLAGGTDPVTDEQRSAAEEALKNMDDFDFNSFRELMMKDLLNNDEQRQIIEERLKPLDLGELIMNSRVTQRIPVRPGQYEPELQSMTGEEELALKRLLMEERGKIAAPDRYLLDKYQLMTIACGLYAINNKILPSHLDEKGNFNDEKFWTKFNMVLKLPFHMLASLGLQYYWFDIRVRKLFVAERLKNS